jgi:hypothetical protein
MLMMIIKEEEINYNNSRRINIMLKIFKKRLFILKNLYSQRKNYKELEKTLSPTQKRTK